jgi:ATP-dependent helicase/nuclease subunit A
MSEAAHAHAEARQRMASDPAVSAFVSASAGSGKTKLLTDRLLRLMLAGAEPARIQCLTYTRAAAAEMAVRLQRTLGAWVTLSDDKLDAELARLAIAPGAATRQAARALFARVLDLPGGMRIGTIHAFCQSLLRRFPLEARLAPHFVLASDADAALAWQAAQEEVLAASALEPERAGALHALAGHVSLEKFRKLVSDLGAEAERLRAAAARGPAPLAALLGAEPDEDACRARAVAWAEETAVREAARIIADRASPAVAEKARRLLDWLARDHHERAENWSAWSDEFLTRAGAPCSPDKLVNARLQRQSPELAAVLQAEQARVLAIEDARRAARTLEVSDAFTRLAAPLLDAYAAQKQRVGLLDYHDLIAHSAGLLGDPGAAWVLYKLDGGLDHLLLDEVQDTAPAQWRIAGALTDEFFAGTGARAARRSVFAVGDRKQSIFGFQGADPDAFAAWREHWRRRVEDAGEEFRVVDLDVSFRSTAPVLALVDAVFADPVAAAGVVPPGETLHHIAARAGQAGRVELWPLPPPPEDPAPDAWQVPEENLHVRHPMLTLAEALAGWIAHETDGHVMRESHARPLRPGDVLVLVRRRNAFARALVRALKARGVQVAGLDRMLLTEQPAIADLLALADALLLAEDDLALACMLTSPLGGLSDDSLMALAMGRAGSLWDALRRRAGERAEWAAAARFFAALLARVDFATPHALFSEALGPLGGRARLFARFGAEAAEPIDELLNAALAYARLHPPSLQGFVHWLRLSAAEVKREAEGAGDAVRVMTVHGAKGLQAPLVILPDTTALPPSETGVLWAEGMPVWVPHKEVSCAAADRLRAAAQARQAEEHNRLLYVALTRAEDRLLICGWQGAKAPPDACWYRMVERGFHRLDGVIAAPFAAIAEAWPGEALSLSAPQSVVPESRGERLEAAAPAPVPGWAGEAAAWQPRPPPPEPAPSVPLAPSRPQDAELGPVPAAASPLTGRAAEAARRGRGRLIHALLQHLPALPERERAAAARRYLAGRGLGLSAEEARAIAADVLGVLAHPALAPLFGPAGRAEVPLTGVVAGRVVGGLVDRLAVLPGEVLIADYKTGRAPPATAAGVPVLYLRQMAAYRAVLAAIHPDRPVRCLLVWTAGPAVMELAPAALDRHAPGAEAAA